MQTYEHANNNEKMRTPHHARCGASQEVDFPDLLKSVDEIKGDFWIRFATSHPKDMSDKLIKVVAEGKKICEHIHLPVQAGDNKILAAMNRGYTVEHYEGLIAKIKKAIPNVSLTTDVIVGFPNETKEQFQNTLKLFKRVKYDLAYIARYSPRPGTAAFKLTDNVDAAEKKRREEELMQVLRQTALANNQRYIGQVVDVLIEGVGRDGLVKGKTRTYKNVKIKNLDLSDDLAGQFVKVKITKAQDFGLIGEVV
jgi:tRNA-2-methylthio-N6-dimethylallyladenosine synthase